MMATIRGLFSGLNEDIRNSRTKKALNLLRRRGRGYVKEINNNPYADKKIKKQARAEYKRSMKLISKQSKRVS